LINTACTLTWSSQCDVYPLVSIIYGLVDRTTYTTRNHYLMTLTRKDKHNLIVPLETSIFLCLVQFGVLSVLALGSWNRLSRLSSTYFEHKLYSINIILDYLNLSSQMKDSLTFIMSLFYIHV